MSTAAEILSEAWQRLEQEATDEAARLFEKAFQTDPTTPDAALGLARVALATNQYEEASLILDQVLARFPDSAGALLYRGAAEEALGLHDTAIRFYELSARLDPKAALAHYALGRAFARQKQWKQAIRELRCATRDDPQSSGAWYALGLAYQETGDPGHAIAALSECVERAPRFRDGYAALADALSSAGRAELAEQVLTIAAELFPPLA